MKYQINNRVISFLANTYKKINLHIISRLVSIPIAGLLITLQAIPEIKANETIGIYYTLSRSNVRNKPSLKGSKIIDIISGGQQLDNAKIEGNWVRFTYKGGTAFVFGKLVGPSYSPVPRISSLLNESKQSWLLSYSSEQNRLAVIHDAGWGGAVDGPYLQIHLVDVKNNKVVERLQLPDPPYEYRNKIDTRNPDIWRQEFLNYGWNKSGVAIQNLLHKHGVSAKSSSAPSIFQKVNPEDADILLKHGTVSLDGKKYNTLTTIKHGQKTLWQRNQDNGEVFTLASVIRIENQILRITLDSENLYGCCKDVLSLHVALVSKEK